MDDTRSRRKGGEEEGPRGAAVLISTADEGDWLWGEIFEYDEAWYYAEIWKMTGREGVAGMCGRW
jgi:hypothetical protein